MAFDLQAPLGQVDERGGAHGDRVGHRPISNVVCLRRTDKGAERAKTRGTGQSHAD
jgi:hypothetical protein